MKKGERFDKSELLKFDEISKDALEYDENPFVTITENNQKATIDKYCDVVFTNNLTDNEEELLEMLHNSKSDVGKVEIDHDKLMLGKKFLKEFW